MSKFEDSDIDKMRAYYRSDVEAAAVYTYLEERGEHAPQPSRHGFDELVGEDGISYVTLSNIDGELVLQQEIRFRAR